MRDLEEKMQKGISPKALISFQIYPVEGKDMLVIETPAGKDLPYAFQNIIYIRSGHATRKADIDTIRDMVLRKQIEPERWERRISTADIEQDIDIQEVNTTLNAIKNMQRAFFRDAHEPGMVLEDLSMAKYGRLTNGGDVMFGKNQTQRLPQLRVRAACFTTDETSESFRDIKSFEGPLVSVLDQVYDFIIRNTPTISTFTRKQLRRQDETLYPSEAIREGLVNAFAHRDYTDSSGGIKVHIYPAHLEIWNSGSLPNGITPDQLISGHLSILRNPDIAHVLYLRGLMEKLGRGSVLIIRACKERGLPAPVWTFGEHTGVTLTFFTPEVTPEVRRLLGVCHGDMTRQELKRLLGLKDDEHFRKAYLLPAIQEGFIEMTQPDKPRSSKQRYRRTHKEPGVSAGGVV